MKACTPQEVQLYDVARGLWRQPQRADATANCVAMAAPHLTLAAAGSRVLLWRRRQLLRSFSGIQRSQNLQNVCL